MILNDITKIVRVLLATFQAVASQDELTQRRIWQIGEVVGAVEDVAVTEQKPDANIAERRIEEAHDIIHRVSRILEMEDGNGTDSSVDRDGGLENDGLLSETPWDGKMRGETIAVEDE
jgi:hypothetical protein